MRIENKQGLALTGFYSNSNGHGKNVSELIKFSKNSWFSFDKKEVALKFVDRMRKEVAEIVIIDLLYPGDWVAIQQRKNIEKAKKIISQLVIK